MSELEQLLAQLRAAAGIHGAEWIQSQVTASLQGVQQNSPRAGPAQQRARRSKPPERFTPERTPQAQRRIGSPQVEPSGPPAKRMPALDGGAPGRNPHPRGMGSPRRVVPAPSSGFEIVRLVWLAMIQSAHQPSEGERARRAPARIGRRSAAPQGGQKNGEGGRAHLPLEDLRRRRAPPSHRWRLRTRVRPGRRRMTSEATLGGNRIGAGRRACQWHGTLRRLMGREDSRHRGGLLIPGCQLICRKWRAAVQKKES